MAGVTWARDVPISNQEEAGGGGEGKRLVTGGCVLGYGRPGSCNFNPSVLGNTI